jgi:Ca-activated chloride channel homolog
MTFLWPGFLILLGLIPLIIGIYILMLRRRRRYAVRFSSLSLVREALPRQSILKRHLPLGLFLLALTSLVIALSRPAAIVTIPTNQTTIILTLDVSGSMRSADIPPSRLQAAENAALSFIQRQKSTTQIGLVAFSGFADLIQPPTTDQEALQAAIESLTTGRATAIGSGILQAIDAIAEVDQNVPPSVSDPALEPPPVPKGVYAPDIIVLLTDGVSNAGPQPVAAAQQAADRGIRIYTIGFGTPNGSVDFGGGSFNNGPSGGSGGLFGGGGGRRFRTGIDEATLKQIAQMTGGAYYTASSAHELENVFQSLPTYLIARHATSEISVLFAALGALLVAGAVVLSLLWHPLP